MGEVAGLVGVDWSDDFTESGSGSVTGLGLHEVPKRVTVEVIKTSTVFVTGTDIVCVAPADNVSAHRSARTTTHQGS